MTKDRMQGEASRRKFLQTTSLWGVGSLMMPNLASAWPTGEIDQQDPMPGKHPEMVILNHRPWNAETPPHLLDQKVTDMDRLFVRNNGLAPSGLDAENWTLEVSGESAVNPQKLTMAQLKTDFDQHTYQLVIECAGNGRSEFDPPATGNQWTTGAVGAPRWTGVKLKDVLNRVGIKKDAVYIGYYGADTHLSGDPNKVPISRGVPIAKALEEESLIAWAANGQELPAIHGYPLRLVFGGWPASTSGKWLNKLVIRNKIHDGAKMTGQSYRVPCQPVAPGSKVPDAQMCIIESMPVKSIITYPKTGAIISRNQIIEIRGHAWAGDLEVSLMEYSVDFGRTWYPLELNPPANRLAWQHWTGQVHFTKPGYYEVWARATDQMDQKQPMVIPGWNPRGYLNNACHRIAIRVE